MTKLGVEPGELRGLSAHESAELFRKFMSRRLDELEHLLRQEEADGIKPHDSSAEKGLHAFGSYLKKVERELLRDRRQRRVKQQDGAEATAKTGVAVEGRQEANGRFFCRLTLLGSLMPTGKAQWQGQPLEQSTSPEETPQVWESWQDGFGKRISDHAFQAFGVKTFDPGGRNRVFDPGRPSKVFDPGICSGVFDSGKTSRVSDLRDCRGQERAESFSPGVSLSARCLGILVGDL